MLFHLELVGQSKVFLFFWSTVVWPRLVFWTVISILTAGIHRGIQISECVTSICFEVVKTVIQSQWCTFIVHLPVPGSVLTTLCVLSPLILTMTLLRQWSSSLTDEEQTQRGWRVCLWSHTKKTEKWGVQIQVSQSSKLLLFATILFCLFMVSTQKTKKRIQWGLFLQLYNDQRERA